MIDISCILCSMNQFMNNRYVQLSGLTLGLAILFGMILWMIFYLLKVPFPVEMLVMMSVLGAIGIVWKFFSWRIG